MADWAPTPDAQRPDTRARWASLATAASIARPAMLARDRTLEVTEVLAPLLAQGGLVRGSTVACSGSAAVSLALALASGPSAAGSWTGVVGVPDLGLAAVAEMGIAMERLLLVAAPPPGSWATVVAAVADGVDVVIVGSVTCRAQEVRKVQSRLTAQGGVLIITGSPGPLSADVVVRTRGVTWEGIHNGHGRLTARRVELEVTGRRQPSLRRSVLWLPGPSGTVEPVSPVHLVAPPADSAPTSLAQVG